MKSHSMDKSDTVVISTQGLSKSYQNSHWSALFVAVALWRFNREEF